MINDKKKKSLYRTAEYYMYNYCSIKAAVLDLREDIVQSGGYAINATGIRAKGEMSNPTQNKAIALEKKVWLDEKWCAVVERIFEEIKGTRYEKLAQMKYIEKRGWNVICTDMHISPTTYYQWVKELVNEVVMVAVEMGIPREEQR